MHWNFQKQTFEENFFEQSYFSNKYFNNPKLGVDKSKHDSFHLKQQNLESTRDVCKSFESKFVMQESILQKKITDNN